MTQVDIFLEHFGVKGMQWGVRKSRESRKDERWSAKRDRANIRMGRYTSKNVHQVAKAASKSMSSDIKALNKSAKYNTKEAKKAIKEDRKSYRGRNPTAIQYKKDVSDIYMKHVKAVAPNHMQVSPSGKWQESLVIGPNYWDVQVRRVDTVTHARISDPDLSMRVRPIFDDDGYIIDVEVVDNILEQSSFTVEAFLEHAGVKGMKWGVRNKSNTSSSSGKTKKLSRKEKKAAAQAATIKKGEDLVKVALREPKALINLNGRAVVTGSEFVSYLSNGGLLNISATSVYARQLDGPNKAYTMTDKTD